MKVMYTGLADFQVFEKADFDKAGVDHKKTTFARREAVEVPDEVGQALISKEGLFGAHSFAEIEEDIAPATDASIDSSTGDPKGGSDEGPATTDTEVAGTPNTPTGSSTKSRSR